LFDPFQLQTCLLQEHVEWWVLADADTDADSNAQKMAFTLLLRSLLETVVNLTCDVKVVRTCRGCWSSWETGGLIWKDAGPVVIIQRAVGEAGAP